MPWRGPAHRACCTDPSPLAIKLIALGAQQMNHGTRPGRPRCRQCPRLHSGQACRAPVLGTDGRVRRDDPESSRGADPAGWPWSWRASGRADRHGASRQARRLGRSGREHRCHDDVLGSGRLEDDLLAAAGGPAPEGGTASSASAKVPRGRLAPRRSRTPTRGGIKRHGACTGF
jgi:hypothetical protein